MIKRLHELTGCTAYAWEGPILRKFYLIQYTYLHMPCGWLRRDDPSSMTAIRCGSCFYDDEAAQRM